MRTPSPCAAALAGAVLVAAAGTAPAQPNVIIIPLGGDGEPLKNVIAVSPRNGDFQSVAAALTSIQDAAEDNPYVVFVGPGVYTETDLVSVPAHVHLMGAGRGITVVTSTRSGNLPGTDAATLELQDLAHVSDLTVRNTGTGTYGIALYSASSTRSTVVANVTARAVGSGGTAHYAAYWNDAEAVIRGSNLLAGGATLVNAAFGSVNIAAGFPQALIQNSVLTGGGNNTPQNCVDSTGTGFAMQLSNSSPLVRNSHLCGGHRGVSVSSNGHVILYGSDVRVSSTASAFLFEITASGSISVANSTVQYVGNKFTGAGTGLRCANVVDFGTNTPLTDGTNKTTACN